MTHISEATIEGYALGRFLGNCAGEVEEHLLLCEFCRAKISHEMQLIRALRAGFRVRMAAHTTADGVVELWIEQTGDKWIGRLKGEMLHGYRQASDQGAAFEAISTSFREMFPEHACGAFCSSVELED
jgi:anti-sigma factor RsiW